MTNLITNCTIVTGMCYIKRNLSLLSGNSPVPLSMLIVHPVTNMVSTVSESDARILVGGVFNLVVSLKFDLLWRLG